MPALPTLARATPSRRGRRSRPAAGGQWTVDGNRRLDGTGIGHRACGLPPARDGARPAARADRRARHAGDGRDAAGLRVWQLVDRTIGSDRARSGYRTSRQVDAVAARSPNSARERSRSAGRPTPRSGTGCSLTSRRRGSGRRLGGFARSLTLPSPEQFDEVSHASGLPTRAEDLGVSYDDDLLFWALRNSHLLRERISIVDLADLLGVWSDETARSIVADAAAVG